MSNLYKDNILQIVDSSIQSVLPDEAVFRSLKDYQFSKGKIIVVSTGKAGFRMAQAAEEFLKDRIEKGVVVTKYHHVKGEIDKFTCFEAGHPVPDENSCTSTQYALDITAGLTKDDTVLLLLSGGGSALFEKPLIDLAELQDLTKQLLSSGADIVEINTIRKRLSAVKGGKFAKHCMPANVFTIVLSDIIGDPLDMIASGPSYPDSSTSQMAMDIINKYNIKVSKEILDLIMVETPKELENVYTNITGSVSQLCEAAKAKCESLGYETIILTDRLCSQAREAGVMLGNIAQTYGKTNKKLAFIMGGETVVKITGEGKGGRNQELALAAAPYIEGINAAVFSVGSDGTDGPTDAAGGFVTGDSNNSLRELGIDVHKVLEANDSYTALEKIDSLIITGPTGTNVNDVCGLLIN